MVYLLICLFVDWLLTKRNYIPFYCCTCLHKASAKRGHTLVPHFSIQQKISHQQQKSCFCDENSKKIDLGKWNCVRNISEVIQTYSKKFVKKNRLPTTNNISEEVLI